MADDTGATSNERLLAAAKQDNEELLEAVFEEGGFDINFQDGLGNTALHYAVTNGSVEVLESILEREDVDVDLQNRLLKETPLHLAAKISEQDLREYLIQSLLEVGVNTRIKNKHNQTAADLLPQDDLKCRGFIRESEAEATVSKEDIASDDEDAGDDVASDDD